MRVIDWHLELSSRLYRHTSQVEKLSICRGEPKFTKYKRNRLRQGAACPLSSTADVALGGLVVSVLATRPKVHWFKPGRGRWILRVIKSAARLPSEGK
jgi:hypothetical protein